MGKESTMKRQTLFVIGFTLVALMASCLYAVDFSGSWALDESKIVQSDTPEMSPQKLDVKQKDDSMTIDSFFSNPMMGDFTVNETMTLDGKLNESETEFGTRKTTATWSDDKKQLTIDSTLLMNWDGNDVEMKTNQVWSLKEGVLQVDYVRNSPMGEITGTVFYNQSK